MKVRAASGRDISPRFFKSLVFYGTFKTAPLQEVSDPSRNKNNSLTISREQDWIKRPEIQACSGEIGMMQSPS